MSTETFPRIHHSMISKSVSKDVTVVGQLKGGSVIELPDNKSINVKSFSGDHLTDKYIEVRGTLVDSQTIKCDSFSDFGKEFGIGF